MLDRSNPPYPIRLFNIIGAKTGLYGSLNFDKLINRARKNTGLVDLGNDFNLESLKRLVESINIEAGLNSFGNLMIREKLIGQLENRLWATHWFKKYPHILELEVLPIVLITGLQRTGTTKMQRLLSALPEARGLLSWEALYPAPIDIEGESARRIKRTRRNENAVKYISPIFQSIHPIHYDKPEEDVLLLDVNFMSTTAEAIMHVPTYAAWLSQQDQTEVYAAEKQLLQLLQWQRGGKFWVLKSPHHLEYLEQFNAVFPDSRVLWMHRTPNESIPSFLSMLYYSRAMFTGEVDKATIKEHWLKKLQQMIVRGLAFKTLHPYKVKDILFDSFISDERKVVLEIAQEEPVRLKNAAEKITSSNSVYQSRHRYNLTDWDLDLVNFNNQFADYQQYIDNLAQK